MNKNFVLTPNLRNFLTADALSYHPLLGHRLPVSILKRGYHSCTIRVFPENGFNFFMGSEIARIYNLAKDFELSSFVVCRDSQIVVDITDYTSKD